MTAILAQAATRIGSPLLGYIIPAAVFGLSFYVAFALFRHFTRQADDSPDHKLD
jgi:hypothetical protein